MTVVGLDEGCEVVMTCKPSERCVVSRYGVIRCADLLKAISNEDGAMQLEARAQLQQAIGYAPTDFAFFTHLQEPALRIVRRAEPFDDMQPWELVPASDVRAQMLRVEWTALKLVRANKLFPAIAASIARLERRVAAYTRALKRRPGRV